MIPESVYIGPSFPHSLRRTRGFRAFSRASGIRELLPDGLVHGASCARGEWLGEVCAWIRLRYDSTSCERE